MALSRLALLLGAASVALGAGCTILPRGAAMQSEIVNRRGDPEDYAFYEVTRALLPVIEAWPDVNVEPTSGWPRRTEGAMGRTIAVGDTVAITLWDSSENSLLTAVEQRFTPLGELVVSPTGRVFIPYAGEVRIAGMSPERARAAIEEQLSSVAASAQVQLNLLEGAANSADVVSGVGQPGVYPLPNRNVSVLNLLSRAGGVAPALRNPRVKLQRGSTLYAVSLDTLYERPAADALVAPGDKLIVDEDDRYFLALGAAGEENIVYFPQDELTALEAISLIGGITDTRADPDGILVLREYPRSALAAGTRGPRETRVIFSINMTTADGLFSAKNLRIMPGDVVLATESPVSSVQLALSVLGGGAGFARQLSN